MDSVKWDGDDRAGCEILRSRLEVVRPKVHVCGHIHGGREVERVRWKEGVEESDIVQSWSDPGKGNKKISLLDLTRKSGRALENDSGALPRHFVLESLRDAFEAQPDANGESEGLQPDVDTSLPTLSLDDGALQSEARWRRKRGGAMQYTSLGCGEVDAHNEGPFGGKLETAMINAAFLGPRIPGKTMEFNKPIVVDVDLPVWQFCPSITS